VVFTNRPPLATYLINNKKLAPTLDKPPACIHHPECKDGKHYHRPLNGPPPFHILESISINTIPTPDKTTILSDISTMAATYVKANMLAFKRNLNTHSNLIPASSRVLKISPRDLQHTFIVWSNDSTTPLATIPYARLRHLWRSWTPPTPPTPSHFINTLRDVASTDHNPSSSNAWTIPPPFYKWCHDNFNCIVERFASPLNHSSHFMPIPSHKNPCGHHYGFLTALVKNN
jgi:hypothetical protein